MKKVVSLFIGLFFSIALFAQTFNINQGNITYAIPASQMGDAIIQDNQIVIGNVAYDIVDINNITIDDSEVKDNTVYVKYSGATANVVIAGNIAHLLSAKVEGAHVTLLQSIDTKDEITYSLNGSSTDGSFYMDGNIKATIELNGLTLTNPDSCAINIQDGKRISVLLNEGTTNTLTDGIKGTDDGSDAHKACFYIDGHSEISGKGTLTINGMVKHGFCSDEYCKVKTNTGAINVVSAHGDGFHIGQYYEQNGGSISISSFGDGIDVGVKKDNSVEKNGELFINGGSVSINTTGAATKGLKCDASMEINGGVVNVTCTGDAYFDATENDVTSASALKCAGTFNMTDGTVNMLATGKGGKLLNSDGKVTISGGLVSGAACGDIYVYNTENDSKAHGIKTDSDIVISGGEVYIAASEDEGKAFKTDYKWRYSYGNRRKEIRIFR